jgi:hypothetical protein
MSIIIKKNTIFILMIRYITNKSIRMLGLLLAIGLAFSLNSCNNQSVQETKSTIVENQDPLIVDQSNEVLDVHEQIFEIVKKTNYKKKIIVNFYGKDQYGNNSVVAHYDFIINNEIWNEMQKYQSYGDWIQYCFGKYDNNPNGSYPYEFKYIEN